MRSPLAAGCTTYNIDARAHELLANRRSEPRLSPNIGVLKR